MARRYWTLLSVVSVIFFVYLLLTLILPSSSQSPPIETDDTLNYGIVIDAGSTGSRLFLYSFNGGSETELISVRSVKDENDADVIKKVTPGLSTFKDHPEAAPDYIKPLLNYASKYIPPERQPYTPVFIFATAGMRLLAKEEQDAITTALRTKLPTMTTLQILPEHIQVIDGKWEGIYSWIAVNYVLGKFKNTGPNNSQSTLTPSSRGTTAGMIDMGGASVQIAFELPEATEFKQDTVNTVNLGCMDNDKQFVYHLYVTTFLGYGVNEGLKKYEHTLNQRISTTTSNSTDLAIPYVRDNCLPNKMMKVASTDKAPDFLRIGTGNWDECVGEIVSIFKKTSDCSAALKCFFDGVQAPPVDLSSIELYGFSEYWYSMHDVLSLGGVYHHDTFEKSARMFCSKPWDKIKTEDAYHNAEVDRLEGQCFKSAWIHAALHDGFHVNELKHKFQTALRIRDQEVQWALGALIYQMRYYPLRKIQQSHAHLKHSDSSLYPIIFAFGVFILLIVAIVLLKRYWSPNSRLAPRRDPTTWGYRKVSQDPYVSSRNGQLPV